MIRKLKPGLVMIALTAATTVVACSDRLTVPNFQSPTTAQIVADPATAIPLLVTGVLRDDRGALTGYVRDVGILGREIYNYTPTEGRNTSGYLTADVNNQASFGATSGGGWASQFFTIRDAFNTLNAIDSAPAGIFTDAQKTGVHGVMETQSALAFLYIINTRDSLGAPVDVYSDPTKLAPFVTRDSVFSYITGTLNKAYTELTSTGAALPSGVAMPSGYTGFTTPANYAKFNRAIAARVYAYRASLGTSGCGPARSAACYNLALTALGQSFIDPAGSLSLGVNDVYSSAANDVTNGLANQATTAIVAHAKSDSGIMTKADGVTLDDRFTRRLTKLSSPKQPPTSVVAAPTTWDYSIYATRADPVPVIRNEELILLRAEAKYFTGDQVGALADINTIRTRSGGLVARGAFTSDADFLDELLYNRRLSLGFEGHRWVDMRRFGRLNLLTIDKPGHIVVSRLPIPQNECLSRANQSGNLKGPGCT
jgi:hypothetical protein